MKNLDDYAFVVIDEAHNIPKNANTLRAEAVMELLWGEHPKKVMLLTATPVNNSLHDLHTLVSYFVHNNTQFASIGIPSVADYIAAAQALDPNTLSPEHLFGLMDKVAVRRARRFIKKEYANDLILDNRGQLVPIVFPTPVVNQVRYELDPAADELTRQVIHALRVSDDEELVIRSGTNRDPSRLSLARYAPSVYANGADMTTPDHERRTAAVRPAEAIGELDGCSDCDARATRRFAPGVPPRPEGRGRDHRRRATTSTSRPTATISRHSSPRSTNNAEGTSTTLRRTTWLRCNAMSSSTSRCCNTCWASPEIATPAGPMRRCSNCSNS